MTIVRGCHFIHILDRNTKVKNKGKYDRKNACEYSLKSERRKQDEVTTGEESDKY